jgi:hypothetical protein
MADDSVGSAELIDNSVGAAALNISGNGSSGQRIVSDGDGSFSYADASGGVSAPTALTGTSTAIDWSANTQFTHTLSGDTTYTFSNISAGASIELYQKNVGKRFDLFQQTNTTVSFSGQLANTVDMRNAFFNNDGSKFYIANDDGHIFEYNLSTNYAINTASHVQTKTGVSNSGGYQFNGDGSKLIRITGDDLHEHALTTNYDISTVATSAANSVNLDSVVGDTGGTARWPRTSNGQGLSLNNGKFNSDGTKLWLGNARHGNLDSTAQEFFSAMVISLSSAYDITSTLTMTSAFDIGQDLRTHGSSYSGAISSDISHDGHHMLVIQENLDVFQERQMHLYYIETPFDLNTTKRVNTVLVPTFQTGDPISYLNIHPDGLNYHLHSRRNGGFSGNQELRLFDIQGNYKVTFPTVTSSQPQTYGDGGDPTTTSYLRLTSNDGTNVLITDHREIS